MHIMIIIINEVWDLDHSFPIFAKYIGRGGVAISAFGRSFMHADNKAMTRMNSTHKEDCSCIFPGELKYFFALGKMCEEPTPGELLIPLSADLRKLWVKSLCPRIIK
jgi:hypothetical protein